jgi:hypothetical protein
MTLRIYRVTVRGRFAGLDDEARAALLADVDDHDVVTAGAFTERGTLTYDRSIDFFTFRFQLRQHDDDADTRVLEQARDLAEAHLRERGLGHRDLKVQATDMATMWRR